MNFESKSARKDRLRKEREVQYDKDRAEAERKTKETPGFNLVRLTYLIEAAASGGLFKLDEYTNEEYEFIQALERLIEHKDWERNRDPSYD